MKNIVIIGGGTGTSTLLSGLREFPTNNSVIVSTADDGGSTGLLRTELGVVPPGDLRQCLVGLSYGDPVLQKLFNYRFAEGTLKGHAVGNLIISGLEKSTGSIESAIIQTAKLLNVRGQVVPITLHPTQLSAVLENGVSVTGEHNIDEPSYVEASEGAARIKDLQLSPNGPANPRALELIKKADAIVFGPGDLYTSTVPNLLVSGVAEAIADSPAHKILVVNLMTKSGQTSGYKASDFVAAMNRFLSPGKLDTVILNTGRLDSAVLDRYTGEKAEFVEPDAEALKASGVNVVSEALASTNTFEKDGVDSLKRSFLRHDSAKLAKIIYKLVS